MVRVSYDTRGRQLVASRNETARIKPSVCHVVDTLLTCFVKINDCMNLNALRVRLGGSRGNLLITVFGPPNVLEVDWCY